MLLRCFKQGLELLIASDSLPKDFFLKDFILVQGKGNYESHNSHLKCWIIEKVTNEGFKPQKSLGNKT